MLLSWTRRRLLERAAAAAPRGPSHACRQGWPWRLPSPTICREAAILASGNKHTQWWWVELEWRMGLGKASQGQKLNLLFLFSFFVTKWMGNPLTSVTLYKVFNPPSVMANKDLMGKNGESREEEEWKCFLPSTVGDPLNEWFSYDLMWGFI